MRRPELHATGDPSSEAEHVRVQPLFVQPLQLPLSKATDRRDIFRTIFRTVFLAHGGQPQQFWNRFDREFQMLKCGE
jgi:hypothetical protein